ERCGDYGSGYRQLHPCERRDLLSNKNYAFLAGFRRVHDRRRLCRRRYRKRYQHAQRSEYRNVPGYSAGEVPLYWQLLPDRSLSDASFHAGGAEDVQACVQYDLSGAFRSTDLYGRICWSLLHSSYRRVHVPVCTAEIRLEQKRRPATAYLI